MVVVTVDPGENLGENGYHFQHGDLVDQACLHLPLVLCLPGSVAAGLRVTTPVSILDVAPTVLAARLTAELATAGPRADRWRSARQGSLKAVRIPTPDGASWRLYDLTADAGEEHDLVAAGRPVPERLRTTLEQAAAVAMGATAPAVDAAVEAQLRALGYVND